MNHVLAGWAAYWRERQEHKATTEAYEASLIQLRRYADELAKPCPMCAEMERERNNASSTSTPFQVDLDQERKARRLMEQLGFKDVTAGGEPT